MNIKIAPAALEEIAGCLVTDQVTHADLDRKLAELNIYEASPPPSNMNTGPNQRPGRDYWIKGSSKREKLRMAVHTKYRESGGKGVLHLIRTLYSPVSYTSNPEAFREFCNSINRVLRFSWVEYRDDGDFHEVSRTRNLSEAERRAQAVENKLASRRVHPEVQKYWKPQYMEENYFHAVFEASKGLAQRIREKTGLKIDGVALVTQAFDRPKHGYPKLAFSTLATTTEINEHDGFKNFLTGLFQCFRNPIAHTPKINWQHDVEDAVDCLTLISFLHRRLVPFQSDLAG